MLIIDMKNMHQNKNLLNLTIAKWDHSVSQSSRVMMVDVVKLH